MDYRANDRLDLELNWIEVAVGKFVPPPSTVPGVRCVVGDARQVQEFSDFAFDLAHSNSVIEHVGRWRDMAAMVLEVRRVARSYFAQTPYFWFPREPHARFPMLHWMPESWRYRILMARDCGYWT